jgi:hypothetical protein
MYEEINRFIDHPDQSHNFDSLFGTSDWRKCAILARPTDRKRCLHDLYLRQLQSAAKAKYVRSFEMRNKAGRTDYYLFYATNSLLGLKKMKEAMWKVDKLGDFTFSDATNPDQIVLFADEPRYDGLRDQILTRYRGRITTVREIEEFVLAETAFRETHYKRQILALLETAQPPVIEILDARPGRKRGTFGDPTMRIRFA